MAFFNSLSKAFSEGGNLPWEAVKFDFKREMEMFKDLTKGDWSKAGRDFEDSFGDHQRLMTDNLGDMGFDQDEAIFENSDTVAAMVLLGGYLSGDGGASGAESGGTDTSWLEGVTDWWDTTGEGWWDTGNEYKDYYDMADSIMNSSSGQQTAPITGTGSRQGSYTNMIGRLKNMINEEIDPYEEIVIPTGEIY